MTDFSPLNPKCAHCLEATTEGLYLELMGGLKGIRAVLCTKCAYKFSAMGQGSWYIVTREHLTNGHPGLALQIEGPRGE